jgi:photosystem II stability/assembly factor-like uncharacterized protein
MNYFFKILLILISITSFAQIPQNAPWTEAIDTNSKLTSESYNAIQEKGMEYFSTKDKSKKGSGYKPFNRWLEYRAHYVDKTGKLTTAENLWQAWEQKRAMENSENSQNRSTQVVSNWQSVGPYSFIDSGSWSSGQGRVNCMTIDPNNPNNYYAGTPAGGLWSSKDAGLTWSPMTDYLPQIGVSGIAVDPNNSDIIYITTGDDDAGDSYFIGVMKSTDGGNTWNPTGSLSGSSANEIYIDPTNSDIVWVATSSGLFKSEDGGDSWSNKKFGNIKDFKLKPGDPNTIYAVTSSTFYKSTNGGNLFSTITQGLPTSSSRLALDVTPDNPNYVYVLSAATGGGAFQGVYKSTDSGESFDHTGESEDIFDGSGQAWFDMAIGVSDVEASTLFVGVLNIWKSSNQGSNFTRINNWSSDSEPAYTHADIHFLRYFDGVLFAGTDGGLYRSTDNGLSFENLTTGMAIGQFYRLSVSKQSASYMVGGLQDNGGFGYSNNQWYNYHGADGMDAAVNPLNKQEYYGFIQFGGALYKTVTGGPNGNYVAGAPSGESGNWVTPLVMDNAGRLYAGYSQLFRLENNAWTQISNYSFGGNLSVIEIDPNDNDYIYVARGLSIYKSSNRGVTFTNLNVSFSGNEISSIEVNNHDSNILYATTSGSSGKVYQSINGGASWLNITGSLPAESKNVVRHQKYNPNNPIYVGTYLGIYYRDDTLSDWEVFSTNLPNVHVTDLEITEIDNKISASTYGRGIWQSDIPVVLADDDLLVVEMIAPSTNVNCGGITPVLKVKNNGNNVINNIAVDYYLDGIPYQQNWEGTLLSTEYLEISLENQNLDLGQHRIDFSATIENDTYADNNEGSITFYINQWDNTPTTVNTFEATNNEWLRITNDSDINHVWQMAEPQTSLLNTVSSGTKAYITNPQGNYPDNAVSDLYTPCYDLTLIENPVMKFNMAYDIELDWDVLYVEYSTDNGTSWYVLGTAEDPNWYNNSSSENTLTIGGQWSGTNLTLEEYSYDLSALNNESQIVFRFHFASDQYVNGEGVLIDDFVIEGTLLNIHESMLNTVSIYPNPAKDYFMVDCDSQEEIQISMYNVIGEKVLERQLNSQASHSIETTTFTPGVYIIRLKSDNGEIAKKLIIQ